MTRELKFRVRCKKTNQLVCCYSEGLRFTLDTGQLYGDCGLNVTDYYNIEQYTGLKDKDGVEIYEDDIVRGKSGSGVVDYSERGTRFGIHTTKPHYICGTPISKYYSLIGCKRIGNIHENPEMNKQK